MRKPTSSLRWLLPIGALVVCCYVAAYGLGLATTPRLWAPASAALATAGSPPSPPDAMVQPANGDASHTSEHPSALALAAASAAAPAPALALALGRPDAPRTLQPAQGDAFNAIRWQRPEPAPQVRPVVIAPPPPPSAPPMPFTFVGLLMQGAAKPKAFIAKGEALMMVSTGDLLENNTYRVDGISDQEIVITYLPMNTRHNLTVTGGAP